MIDFLRDIETEFDVNKIAINKTPIWGLLRTSFYVSYGNKYNNMIWASQKTKRISYSKILKSFFLSFFYLFRRYDYFFLSESNERKWIKNKNFDKLCDGIIEVFGSKSCLLSELPVNGSMYQKKNTYTQNIITSLLFYYLAKITPLVRYNLTGEDVIENILNKYQLELDYKKTLVLFLKYKRIANFFLKIWKPNAIFIKCYYSPLNQAFISAANSLGIKTIELQHGLISESHPSYNIFTTLDKNVFPQWILTNGVLEKKLLTNTDTKIYDKVIPIGNYYLEFVKSNTKAQLDFVKIKKDFNRVVAITLQDTVEDITISFIQETALIDKKNLYIILPRTYSDKYKSLKQINNIFIDESIRFYDVIPFVDFHCTVYSTCAIESVYFGTPNILLNFENKSSDYFSSILIPDNFNDYINNIPEFLKAINQKEVASKESVIKAHQHIFKPNYQKNISDLKKLILKS